tara:strand:+ start:1038 stop:1184 length:147 start_codon:yes stop_codon:yes gene_type:complete
MNNKTKIGIGVGGFVLIIAGIYYFATKGERAENQNQANLNAVAVNPYI